MTAVSGLAGSPSGYCIQLPARVSKSLNARVSAFSGIGIPRNVRHFDGSYLTRCTENLNPRWITKIKCAMDASFGNPMNDSSAVFPRINVRDPYRRLGISREASEEEIQAARNFLMQRYGGHKSSVDSIESAHDKIIMEKFHERRRPKLNIKKKVRDVSQNRYVQLVMNRFRMPSKKFIVTTSVAFLVLGALTVLFPTEDGPTVQVAISLMATLYFINSRLKSKIRALLYGVGSFIVSWLLGTFLMVSVIPPVLKGPRSLEVTTSLITYLLLWVSSTYLR